jgi:predicted nucleic acid-binding protein
MNVIFADTFFWIAITNTRDQAHEKAKFVARSKQFDAICTTEEVLTEYLNFFAGWGPNLRQKAALNVQNILENSTISVIAQTSGSFRSGLALYRTRFDKGYSLTDCISMELMRSEGITEALTNDSHFEQEGFRAIFRPQRPDES